MISPEIKIPVIVGPTASGKTSLSLALAQSFDAEIVSADSRQVYKFMDIGTAKPTVEERSIAPHHFIDIKTPDEYYSAGQQGSDAFNRVKDILAKKKRPIIVGGSGLYLRALTDGLFEPAIGNTNIKKKLRAEAEEFGISHLYNRLQKVDPATAGRLHINDTQRILRALEVYESTGKPISYHHEQQKTEQKGNWYFIGLQWKRDILYRRIEERVDIMLKKGLLDEVKNLQSKGYDESLISLRTVGYKEVFIYLAGNKKYEEMVEEIKKNSRNYAKRQITWFGRDERIRWFDINDSSDIDTTTKLISQEL